MLKPILIIVFLSISQVISCNQRGLCPPQFHGQRDKTADAFLYAGIIPDIIDYVKMSKLCVSKTIQLNVKK